MSDFIIIYFFIKYWYFVILVLAFIMLLLHFYISSAVKEGTLKALKTFYSDDNKKEKAYIKSVNDYLSNKDIDK